MRQVPRAIRSGGDVVDASPTPGPQALMHVDKQVLEFYEDRWCQVDGEPFTVPLNQRSSVAIMVDVRPLFFSATNDDQFWGGDIVGIGATYPTMSMELNLFVNGSLIGPRSLEEINNFEVPGLIQTHGPRLNLMTVTTVDGEITITPRLLMHGGGDEVVRSVSDPPRFRERAWSDNYEWESQYISILLIDEDYWYVLVPFNGVSESVVTAYRYPRRSVYDGFLFSPDCPVDPYPGNPNHAAHLGQVALSSWDFCWEWDSSHRNRFPTDSGWDSLDYLRDWIVISGDRLVYITMGPLNDPLYGENGLAVWSANYKTADLKTGIDNPHNFDLIYSIANEYFARCLWEDPDQVSNPGGVYLCYADVVDLGGSADIVTITRLDVGGNVLSSSTHGPIPKADFGDGDAVPVNRHRGFEKDKTGVWFFYSTHNTENYSVLVRYDFASDSCSWLVIAGRVLAEGNPIETRNPYSVWVQVRVGTGQSNQYWKEVQYVNGSLVVTQTIKMEYVSHGNQFFNAYEGVRYHSPTAPEDHAYVVFTEESAAALVTTELIVGVNTEDDCTEIDLTRFVFVYGDYEGFNSGWPTRKLQTRIGVLTFDGSLWNLETHLIQETDVANDDYTTHRRPGGTIGYNHETGTAAVVPWQDEHYQSGRIYLLDVDTGQVTIGPDAVDQDNWRYDGVYNSSFGPANSVLQVDNAGYFVGFFESAWIIKYHPITGAIVETGQAYQGSPCVVVGGYDMDQVYMVEQARQGSNGKWYAIWGYWNIDLGGTTLTDIRGPDNQLGTSDDLVQTWPAVHSLPYAPISDDGTWALSPDFGWNDVTTQTWSRASTQDGVWGSSRSLLTAENDPSILLALGPEQPARTDTTPPVPLYVHYSTNGGTTWNVYASSNGASVTLSPRDAPDLNMVHWKAQGVWLLYRKIFGAQAGHYIWYLTDPTNPVWEEFILGLTITYEIKGWYAAGDYLVILVDNGPGLDILVFDSLTNFENLNSVHSQSLSTGWEAANAYIYLDDYPHYSGVSGGTNQ